MTFWQVIKKYLNFVLKAKKMYISFLVLLFFIVILSRLNVWFFGIIIDEVVRENLDYAVKLVFLYLSIRVVRVIFNNIAFFLVSRINSKYLRKEAKMEYLINILNLDYEYHANKSSGKLISIGKRGENALITMLFEVNFETLRIVLELILSVLFLAFIDYRLAILLFITLSITFFVGMFFLRMNVKWRKNFNKKDDYITGMVVDNMTGFETVKIFAREKEEILRQEKVYEKWIKYLNRFQDTFRFLDLSINGVLILGVLGMFLFGISLLKNNLITVGAFSAAFFYITNSSRRIGILIFKSRMLAQIFADLKKYFEVMQTKSKIKDKKNASELKNIKGNISFNNVTFSYKNETEVIKNVSLKIKEKKSIALVGISGSGKTTLTKLLMRFYEPKEGKIFIDENNILDVTQKSLRLNIGLVPQDPILFNESIGYNIGYGRPNASREEIINAAKKARVHSFIKNLPEGYKTIVGERGIKLSGGQKQRIAIARVILENPPIIIFDEATSQLDSKNEKAIQKAFRNLTKEKTTILIAHRLSTVVNVNKIYVFEKGKIIEEGNHYELLKRKGMYSKLWKMQTEIF